MRKPTAKRGSPSDLPRGKDSSTMHRHSGFPPLTAALVLVLAVVSQAQLRSYSANKVYGDVNLVSSVVRATVGPQWIDVEEDAELQVTASGEGPQGYQVVGKLSLPPSAVVTGCLLWRGDTVLTGKLRAHYVAGQSYDSIVKNDTGSFSSDPLVLEKVEGGLYNLRAYPFAPRGSRRLRLRYLVPVLSRNGDVPVLPVFSQIGGGQKPLNWTLLLRGKISPVTIVRDDKRTVVTAPSSQKQTFPATGTVALNWGSNPAAGAPRAVFDRVTGGTWAGDYVLYTGRIPDSLARKVALRSETVLLWRWIHPETFQKSGDSALVVDQAQRLKGLVDFLAGQGDKVGLVVDQGLDEVVKTYPIADSGSAELRSIKTWLSGIDQAYLDWRFPNDGTPASTATTLDLSRNRTRFTQDMDSVARLFSQDAGVIRHLLVVTVGPVPSGGELQEVVDLGSLSDDVSVSTSRFSGDEFRWDAATSAYLPAGFSPAIWPGVNLNEIAAVRDGGESLVLSHGVWIPRSRVAVNGTISIEGPRGDVSTLVDLKKGADGAWLGSVAVHESKLGKTLHWIVQDDAGNVLASWEAAPEWTEFVDDSIVPRIWANLESRTSQMSGFDLPSISLATTFGFVDDRYSLLSMAGDTVGRALSPSFADSGLPFLSVKDIFPSTAFKNGPGMPTGVRPLASSKLRLSLVWMPARGMVRIEFGSEAPQSLEVFDVQGHLLQRWNGTELAGKTQVEWAPGDRSRLRGNLVLVRMVTASGVRSMPLALP